MPRESFIQGQIIDLNGCWAVTDIAGVMAAYARKRRSLAPETGSGDRRNFDTQIHYSMLFR